MKIQDSVELIYKNNNNTFVFTKFDLIKFYWDINDTDKLTSKYR